MTDQPAVDLRFAGSVPEIYDTHLVPLIFQPYADDLAERLRAGGDGRRSPMIALTQSIAAR